MRCKIFKLSLLFLLTAYFTTIAWADTTDSGIKLDKKSYVGLSDKMTITVTAPEYNISRSSIDNIMVKVQTNENPEAYSFCLQETDLNTGVFKGYIRFSIDKTDIKSRYIKVKSGTAINVSFDNNIVKASWYPYDAKVKLDKAAYEGEGTRPNITVTDNDLNIDFNKKEELFVTVSSPTDPKGFILKLEESSINSGIFKGGFGLSLKYTSKADKVVKVSYNENILVTYIDEQNSIGNNKSMTASALWKPYTGTLKFSKANYVGLLTNGTVSVTDYDLNIRVGYRDTARIRLTSNADPRGIIITAIETGANSGIFTGNFGFNTSASSSDRGELQVNSSDSIVATYIDDKSKTNIINEVIAVTAAFQYSDAKLQTSADNTGGTGNMLTVTINEPDANNPKIRDRIIAKLQSTASTQEFTLVLEETGTNTGVFSGKVYFSEEKSTNRRLQVYSKDKIIIKYVDTTPVEGDEMEIVKTFDWIYQSSILTLDKESYIGYNSPAKITLYNMDENKDEDDIEYVTVRVSTSDSLHIDLKLKEKSADSGEFVGTVYFGKSSKQPKGMVKIINGSSLSVTYSGKKRNDIEAECTAIWSAQDGELSLDRQDYKGDNMPVKITLKDWDIAEDPYVKDTINVIAKIQGGTKQKSITLTETYKNSGIFTGILYINGSFDKHPSITLSPGDKLEVVYTDKDTTVGVAEDRKAYATWGGISEAKLTLDKAVYKGYDTYMTINLNDFDQNWNTTARDRVYVLVKSKSGKTNMEYMLTETGYNTGIFTAQLKLIKEAPGTGKIRVMASDKITVSFEEKDVSTGAEFKE